MKILIQELSEEHWSSRDVVTVGQNQVLFFKVIQISELESVMEFFGKLKMKRLGVQTI